MQAEHHFSALTAAAVAAVLILSLGPLGFVGAGPLLTGVGLTMPRDSASRVALVWPGVAILVVTVALLAMSIPAGVESGGQVDAIQSR